MCALLAIHRSVSLLIDSNNVVRWDVMKCSTFDLTERHLRWSNIRVINYKLAWYTAVKTNSFDFRWVGIISRGRWSSVYSLRTETFIKHRAHICLLKRELITRRWCKTNQTLKLLIYPQLIHVYVSLMYSHLIPLDCSYYLTLLNKKEYKHELLLLFVFSVCSRRRPRLKLRLCVDPSFDVEKVHHVRTHD